MKRTITYLLFMVSMINQVLAGNVTVKFTGLIEGDKASLCIASDSYLATLPVTTDGTYTFTDVPAGKHSVKAEATGYNVIEALTVIINGDGSVTPSEPLRIPITKMTDDPNNWNFEWKEDGSPSGYTTTSNVNKPSEIDFLGKMIVPADVPSFGVLENIYHVVLSNEEKEWTQEYAYRMVETLKTLPTDYSNSKPAKFTLTSEHLTDDIIINDLGEGYEVRISEDVFYYANPFLVDLDGVRGRLFSKRLHHALTNYVTDFGRDEWRVENIMFNRFGCHVMNVDYENLTKGTTNEDAGRFQQFHPEELVSIINMFEELPEGFHKIPHLNYLIRRKDGHKHPIYPEFVAIAWTQDDGYIEFMESAFGSNSQSFDTLRIILHEKTHFLWAFTFSEEIKKEWIEIGGWYEDPNAKEGWSTTKDTEFVTQYAHEKNPNEDMAESVAYYLKDPALLQSRSIDKYNFLRDRIMHGVRYISTVPDYLSFEVLNLWPDYDYPGKIKRVSVNVDGAPEEDKVITMEIELNHIEGYQDGASRAYTRITSPEFYDEKGNKYSQFIDIHFNPVEGSEHLFRGTAQVAKYSKLGHWTASDITISDLQGNTRYEGRNDCVVDIYINNPLEDVEPATYESGSLKYELTDIEVEGHHCQNLKATYKIKDNCGISNTFARIYAESEGFNTGGTGLTDQYGSYDPETQEAEINFMIPDYFPTANYYLPFIEFYDLATTSTRIQFSESPGDEPIQRIFIETSTPDKTHPEIDLNRLSVYAEPTHPEAPDGETKVTINFYVKDDISGFEGCHYHFIDPQGILHGNFWYYHRNSYTTFFDGDPTVWEHHQIVHILPQGSAPGRWGLARMMVSDKAGNEYHYNFVETLIFEPDDDMSKYKLFAEMDESDMVYITVSSEDGSSVGFNYRIIHETTGQEISGSTTGTSDTRSGDTPEMTNLSVDVSDLPDGDLIVIVNILDETGSIESSKSSRVIKNSIVKATSLAISPETWSGEEGESFKIEAIVLPENTTNPSLSFESDNSDVASVDSEGIVKIVKEGTCRIIVSTTDGSELKATCIITGLADIDSILTDKDARFEVYNLNGVCLRHDSTLENLKQLQPGVYIIKYDKKVKVVRIG